MSPGKYIALLIFAIYACGGLFLVSHLGNIDLAKLAGKFSQVTDEVDNSEPLKKIELPAYDKLLSKDPLGQTKIPGTLRDHPTSSSTITFDSLDDAIAYARTLDGTLRSAATIRPYFTLN